MNAWNVMGKGILILTERLGSEDDVEWDILPDTGCRTYSSTIGELLPIGGVKVFFYP